MDDKLPLGKQKCRFLKALRMEFAKRNNIDYTPAECHHKGDCLGTCPACDAELKFLNEIVCVKNISGENVVF